MRKKLVIIFVLIGFLVLGNMPLTIADDSDLAQQYAPILYFERGEKCFPVNVSYSLENSYLYQVTETGPMLITQTPTVEEIMKYNLTQSQYQHPEYFYLDNQKGTVNDNGIIDDYQSKMNTLGYTVYAHVVSSGNQTIIQYWFFYVFNPGDMNRHEGDWEMIQVVLSNGQPTEAMNSQHYFGQRAMWNQVDHEGDHIKDYIARGSHANYFRSYSGKFGFASDMVGSNGKILQPTDYTIELLGSQGWLQFAGHWGWVGGDQGQAIESSVLGEAGPQGPMYRENGKMWDALTWGTGLMQVNDIFFLLDWFLYNFMMIFILATLVTILILCFFIYRRHKKYGLGPRLFSMFYIDGLNKKSIGNILCIVGIVIAVIGLVMPWYDVNINIDIPGYMQTGLVDLLAVDGLKGVQVTLPDTSGPIPLGSFALPFSLFIGIGLVFLIFGTVGIAQSKKLGRKYVFRGIKLLIPFISVLIMIMVLGLIFSLVSPVDTQGISGISEAVSAVASSPFGGQTTVTITDITGQVYLSWGFGIGLYLLLAAGIIMIIAGILESAARTTFFEQKQIEQTRKEKKKKQNEPSPVEEKKK